MGDQEMNCCNADMKKVILYGLPMKFCPNCSTLTGFSANIMRILPFNGVLFIYEGNYLKGLLGWLTNNEWMA